MMRQLEFTFDVGPVFSGFTDDTTWNGFINVWVTPATRQAMAECGDLWGWGSPIEELLSLPRDEDGLISLARGYSTQEVGL